MHDSSRTSRQKGLCPPAAGAHRKALNSGLLSMLMRLAYISVGLSPTFPPTRLGKSGPSFRVVNLIAASLVSTRQLSAGDPGEVRSRLSTPDLYRLIHFGTTRGPFVISFEST